MKATQCGNLRGCFVNSGLEIARIPKSFRIAEVRYREGVDDVQTVLQAQS